MESNSDFWISVVVFVAGILLMVAMYRLEKQPKGNLNPRLLPTTLVLLIGLVIALGAGFHLLAYAGIKPPVH